MSKYLDKISLKNKNIIVTGACGLIGREICKGIAEFGGNLVICDVNTAELEILTNELSCYYDIKVMSQFVDITSEDSVDNMIKEVLNHMGNIYGLVNSAYPRNKKYGTLYENIELDSWRENVDIHLNGYFNITQKVSKQMIQNKRGNIINIASIYGMLAPDFSIYEGTKMTMPAEYSAIKGAIINFTKYLSTYLAKDNIRVNCISPGGIENNQPESFIEKYNKKTPLQRMGEPEEIVGGIIYLLSDLSSYVTGHNLVIDGGWSVW